MYGLPDIRFGDFGIGYPFHDGVVYAIAKHSVNSYSLWMDSSEAYLFFALFQDSSLQC